MKKKSLKEYYDSYCDSNAGYAEEYTLISFNDEDEGEIVLKHNLCGETSIKNRNLYRKSPFCGRSECMEVKRKATHVERYGFENASMVKEFQDKRTQTFIERFGETNPLKNQSVKDKAKKTNLERYGCENVFQNNDIKNKIKETNIRNLGVEYPTQNKDVLYKMKNTNLDRYGCENVFQNDDIKEKIKNTNIKKYGHYSSMMNKNIARKASYTLLDKSYDNLIINNNHITPLFSREEYYGNRKEYNYYYKFKCNLCGNEFEDYLHSNTPRCKKCNPLSGGTSIIEKEIFNFIQNKIDCINGERFYEGNKYKYELDIFVPEKNFGIELDGVYWHSELGGGKDKYYHLEKTKWFNENGIDIIHIFDSEWIGKQEIIKSIISAKLGLIENKVFARKCEISVIKSSDAKKFLNDNHLQGNINSLFNLALVYNDEIVSLLTIGKSRFNKNYDFEILRFCNKLNINVIGGFSKLLNYFCSEIKENKSIITYADRRFSNGNVYLKNGFSFISNSQPNYFYTRDYMFLESRQKFQKHKLKDKLEVFNAELTEWHNMQNNGYDRIWDCGNMVFIKN